jgi:hypothetical protein
MPGQLTGAAGAAKHLSKRQMTIKREENKIKPVSILDTDGAQDSPRVDFYDRIGPSE